MPKKNIHLCLGIDPKPLNHGIENFRACVKKHQEFLDNNSLPPNERYFKPQLAYFLAYGSKGIEVLEELVAKYKEKYTIILDGKFNDIATTLEAYLHFSFQTLQVHGVTISPFLGEKTLETAFTECAKHVGPKGRVYSLCATTETGHGHLSYLQKNWKENLNACQDVRDKVFKNDKELKKIAGVVIGANREEVLCSKEFVQSNLSALSPGLGAQNADWNIIQKCATQPNEILFPISRGVFAGGNLSLHEMEQNIKNIQDHF